MEFNSKKVFVGNLPFSITKNDLESMFSTYGTIIGVNIREDRATGKPKGFAFVTFEDNEAAAAAIQSMNHYSYGGRTLTVSQASIRGTDDKSGQNSQVDNSWKTVPLPAPSARGKADKKGGKTTSSAAKPQATWDHWAGPVAKPASTATASSNTK